MSHHLPTEKTPKRSRFIKTSKHLLLGKTMTKKVAVANDLRLARRVTPQTIYLFRASPHLVKKMPTSSTRVSAAPSAKRVDQTDLLTRKTSGQALRLRSLSRLWSLDSKLVQSEGKRGIRTSH